MGPIRAVRGGREARKLFGKFVEAPKWNRVSGRFSDHLRPLLLEGSEQPSVALGSKTLWQKRRPWFLYPENWFCNAWMFLVAAIYFTNPS